MRRHTTRLPHSVDTAEEKGKREDARAARRFETMPKACKHCPSAHYEPDPEALDIRDHYPREEQINTLFACAWGDGRLCKGYCDFLGVTAEERAALALRRGGQ